MSYSIFDEQPDLVLDELDYEETRNGISVDKFIFDDYHKDAYINIKFVDDNSDEIYFYKMIGEDDEKIYFEFIG